MRVCLAKKNLLERRQVLGEEFVFVKNRRQILHQLAGGLWVARHDSSWLRAQASFGYGGERSNDQVSLGVCGFSADTVVIWVSSIRKSTNSNGLTVMLLPGCSLASPGFESIISNGFVPGSTQCTPGNPASRSMISERYILRPNGHPLPSRPPIRG